MHRASKNRKLFGIFGAMLLAYTTCFAPGVVIAILIPITADLPDEFFIVALVCFQFITIASALVQSYFRPDIKKGIVAFCRRTDKGINLHKVNNHDLELDKLTTQYTAPVVSPIDSFTKGP